MASSIIGRTACPECGFHGAHVKQSDKCIFRYCPECHSQTFAKAGRQMELMRAKMRPVPGAEAPAPAADASAEPVAAVLPATPTAGSAPTAPAAAAGAPRPPVPARPADTPRRGLFGW